MKLKVGDKVKVITGKDKGKEGTIIKTFKEEGKVLVEGINMVKKHIKSNGMTTSGGILETEAKIDASNVMIIDPKTKKTTRIYHEIDSKTNKKIRVSKSHEKLD